jgi:hypothetical protein
MSHSTHVGFSCPPVSSFNAVWPWFLAIISREPLPPSKPIPPPVLLALLGVGNCATVSFRLLMPWPSAFFLAMYSGLCGGKWSLACGVGHITTALLNLKSPLPPFWFGPPFAPSVASGVGHCFTWADSFGSPRLFILPALRLQASSATGVCHNPNAFPLVRCPGIGSAQHSPSRIVPQRGQVSEYDTKPPRSENWAVFHEAVTWSYLANDPGHLSPQAASFAGNPNTSTGGTDVLAGKPARNHVNNSLPWSSVKGADIRPNREWFKKSVVLPLCQNGCGVGITFNGADGTPSKQVAPEYAATSACEKSQLIHLVPGNALTRRFT